MNHHINHLEDDLIINDYDFLNLWEISFLTSPLFNHCLEYCGNYQYIIFPSKLKDERKMRTFWFLGCLLFSLFIEKVAIYSSAFIPIAIYSLAIYLRRHLFRRHLFLAIYYGAIYFSLFNGSAFFHRWHLFLFCSLDSLFSLAFCLKKINGCCRW